MSGTSLVAKWEFWTCSTVMAEQAPGEEPDRPAVQPPAEQDQQEHRGRAPERRERAPDEDRGVVAENHEWKSDKAAVATLRHVAAGTSRRRRSAG